MDIRIIEILKKISDKQYKAYLVGGSSRDYLLNKEFTDIDIATSAPIAFLEENFEILSLTRKCFGSLKINYKTLSTLSKIKSNVMHPKICVNHFRGHFVVIKIVYK